MIAALGLTMMMAGFIFGYAVTIAGLLYFVVAVGGWSLESTG